MRTQILQHYKVNLKLNIHYDYLENKNKITKERKNDKQLLECNPDLKTYSLCVGVLMFAKTVVTPIILLKRLLTEFHS